LPRAVTAGPAQRHPNPEGAHVLDNQKDPDRLVNRRDLLGAAALGAAAATLGTASSPAEAAADPKVAVHVGGKYEQVPLRKDSLRVTAVQSVIRSVRDTRNPAKEMKANVDHMLDMVDAANGFPGPQDLVCFHEQPIMGWQPWTLDEALRVSIEVPGPETEALGKKAKQHGCYITFGTYAKDKDWPGHLLLNGILIGPDGNVVANHWKTNNSRGFKPGWDIFTTSIYDVLDRYREMYGEDAVLPIARTDIGNISCSITPGQADVMRAHTMKGLELRLSSSSGGYNLEDTAVISLHNRLWTVVVNQSLSPDQPGFPEFSGSGDTAIFGPNGRIVARARSINEEFVSTVIPIAEFRRTRSIPDVPMEMLMPVYSKYVPRNGPNAQASYVPKTSEEASKHFISKRNW
jgi:predicted amidohydrolase